MYSEQLSEAPKKGPRKMRAQTRKAGRAVFCGAGPKSKCKPKKPIERSEM